MRETDSCIFEGDRGWAYLTMHKVFVAVNIFFYEYFPMFKARLVDFSGCCFCCYCGNKHILKEYLICPDFYKVD